eukprot:scaffold341861_cov18-Prasinocladus_malaysianus.AAC.1
MAKIGLYVGWSRQPLHSELYASRVALVQLRASRLWNLFEMYTAIIVFRNNHHHQKKALLVTAAIWLM